MSEAAEPCSNELAEAVVEAEAVGGGDASAVAITLPAATPPAEVGAPKAQASADARPFVCAVPGCDKAYMDQAGLAQHQRAGCIAVGSRVIDSEGTRGVIVARSFAWLTMRTDAGEDRSVRKATLKLIAPASVGAPANDLSKGEADAADVLTMLGQSTMAKSASGPRGKK